MNEQSKRELKALRVKHGLTQKQLAEKLGMSEFAYNKRENGHIDFTVSELNKLKHALSMTNKDIEKIFFSNDVAFDATGETA